LRTLQELLRNAELNVDSCAGVRVLAQNVIEIEVAGTERYERAANRSGEHGGSRDRSWDTRVGSIELQVPHMRVGSYYPALPEPR
jgi:transposase-like protein